VKAYNAASFMSLSTVLKLDWPLLLGTRSKTLFIVDKPLVVKKMMIVHGDALSSFVFLVLKKVRRRIT
jgi:hypothetical protein